MYSCTKKTGCNIIGHSQNGWIYFCIGVSTVNLIKALQASVVFLGSKNTMKKYNFCQKRFFATVFQLNNDR